MNQGNEEDCKLIFCLENHRNAFEYFSKGENFFFNMQENIYGPYKNHLESLFAISKLFALQLEISQNNYEMLMEVADQFDNCLDKKHENYV